MVAIHDRVDAQAGLFARGEQGFGIVRVVRGAAFDLLEAAVARELELVLHRQVFRQHTVQDGFLDWKTRRALGGEKRRGESGCGEEISTCHANVTPVSRPTLWM